MANSTLDKLKISRDTQVPTASGSRQRRLFMIAAAATLVVIAVLLAVRKRGITVETVTVSQVYPTQTFTLLNASGYLVAQRKAAVASKMTGRLEWIGVEEGSRVTAGQVLARLENLDLLAAVDQSGAGLHTAQAALEQAQAEKDDAAKAFERQQELIRQGIVARAEYDLAEARYRRAVAAVSGAQATIRSASAALRGAQVAYEYSQIRAPFDGVVLTKNADVGDIITPLGAAANAKAAVVTMADLLSLEVEADVAESSLGQVYTRQPCEITLDALPGTRLRGLVHTVVPTADRSKASVLVKVRFHDKDSRLLPEMSAKVAFLSREATKQDQQPRIAITPAAITGQGRATRVYRIVAGRAVAVPVVVGQKIGDLVEVSGVNPGEKLVLRPLERLKPGSRVRVSDR